MRTAVAPTETWEVVICGVDTWKVEARLMESGAVETPDVESRSAGADASGMDAWTAEESPIEISGAEASRAEISGTETSGVETSGAEMSGAETSGAGASGTEMSGAETSGVGTSGTEMSGVETSGVGTSGTETSGVGTSGADTGGAATETALGVSTATSGACAELMLAPVRPANATVALMPRRRAVVEKLPVFRFKSARVVEDVHEDIYPNLCRETLWFVACQDTYSFLGTGSASPAVGSRRLSVRSAATCRSCLPPLLVGMIDRLLRRGVASGRVLRAGGGRPGG